MVDSHLHIDKLKEEEVKEAVREGIVMWSTSSNYESLLKNLEFKRRYPKNIKIFAGIHPEDPANFDDFEKVLNILDERVEEIDGIGEIGIAAFYLEKFSHEKLREGMEILEVFIERAKKYNLPIVFHIVGEDIYKVLPILDRYSIERAMFHWYIGGEREISEIVKRGYLVSVNIECRENIEYREYVKTLQLENIVAETDAPYGYRRETSVMEIMGSYESISEILNIPYNIVRERMERSSSEFISRVME